MTKTCDVCAKESKYKCPTCFVQYCSITCCKKHKENCVAPPKVHQDNEQPENKVVTDNSTSILPNHTLELLKTDKDLKNMLSNPHLRNLLKTIDQAENADDIMQKAMQEPIFVELADKFLQTIEPTQQNSSDIDLLAPEL